MALAERVFGGIARARGDRALHPHGSVLDATFSPAGAGASVYGDGRHQDLLMASSLAFPLGRHLLVPGRDFGRVFYSSVLVYDIGGRLMLTGARVAGAAGRTIAGLESAVATRGLAVQLLVAAPRGRFETVAELQLHRVADEARTIRFNPWVTGGQIRPAGPLREATARPRRRLRIRGTAVFAPSMPCRGGPGCRRALPSAAPVAGCRSG